MPRGLNKFIPTAKARKLAAHNSEDIHPRMVSHSELRKLFCSADAVCFDVDSTVIREEGIDELAKICGVEDKHLPSGGCCADLGMSTLRKADLAGLTVGSPS
ncbi:hypothetical protein P7K49_004288 [Saguinus oedipus]|uniref:Phosphoserine phosphatase n=1 Tax=Saguinus oedipus TaxID=9490 RepID=A0ABQ9W6Y9_SAGOE|nr:hypothetical protein P7K49_004288 [Saguinus oedipus]